MATLLKPRDPRELSRGTAELVDWNTLDSAIMQVPGQIMGAGVDAAALPGDYGDRVNAVFEASKVAFKAALEPLKTQTTRMNSIVLPGSGIALVLGLLVLAAAPFLASPGTATEASTHKDAASTVPHGTESGGTVSTTEGTKGHMPGPLAVGAVIGGGTVGLVGLGGMIACILFSWRLGRDQALLELTPEMYRTVFALAETKDQQLLAFNAYLEHVTRLRAGLIGAAEDAVIRNQPHEH